MGKEKKKRTKDVVATLLHNRPVSAKKLVPRITIPLDEYEFLRDVVDAARSASGAEELTGDAPSKVRTLKLPDGNTEYEKLRDGILEAPATWLPGLLIAAVVASVKNNVFQAGGLLNIVQRVILKESPNALEAASAKEHNGTTPTPSGIVR